MNIEAFLNIEKKYNLLNIRINECPIWAYVRFDTWNYRICSQMLNLCDKQNIKRFNVPIVIINTLKSLFSIVRAKKTDLVFLEHERKVLVDGYYEDIYTGAIVEQYPKSTVIAHTTMEKYYRPTKEKNVIHTEWLSLMSKIRGIINNRIDKSHSAEYRNKLEEMFKSAFDELQEIYGWQVDDKFYEECIRIIDKYNIDKKQYLKLIKRISPKILVEVVHYEQRNMMFNEIATILNIPTVELQHGTMHGTHAAYIYHKETEKLSWLPNYIYLFSDFWKKKIQMPIEEDKLISVGFPYFDRMRNNMLSTTSEEKGIKNILFISQWTIGDKLSELAVRLNRLLDQNKYHIIYKLHPSELSDWEIKYKNLIDSNVEIDESKNSIYSLFAKCSYQIGVYSTAIYEGLGFGLRTFIYSVGHYDEMNDVVNEGCAEIILNEEDLFAKLDMPFDSVARQEFWKNNSMNNLKSELDKLISMEK